MLYNNNFIRVKEEEKYIKVTLVGHKSYPVGWATSLRSREDRFGGLPLF